jgi:Zn-finger nucleic acid-binding protein
VALTPESDADEETNHTCPECGIEQCLLSRRLGDERVTVLECQRCVGFWLGPDAFRQLIERAKRDALPTGTSLEYPQDVAAKFGLPVGATIPKSQQRKWRYRPCVVCHELMVRRNYGRESGVILDMCREHGIWFDADELARILVWIRAGGRPKKRTKKIRTKTQDDVPTPFGYDFGPTSGGFFGGLLEYLMGARNRTW